MYFSGTKCFNLILCSILSTAVTAKDVKTALVGEGLRKPLCFVENKGQVMDETNHPRNDIQFKVATPGMSMYVANGHLYYQYKEVESKPGDANLKVLGYRMDMTLIGANPNAVVTTSEEQEYCENYYLMQYGVNGFTAHSYNRITYKNVYPGIDWVLYIKNDKVEYDFVVNPGGNAKDIRMAFDGATNLNLTNDGSLMAVTPMGSVETRKPVAFETITGKPVSSSFALNGNVLSFNTGSYSGALTIDPYLVWSSYYGGTAEDVVTSVKATTGGSTFAGGYTASNNAIATLGAIHNSYLGGSYDAFLAKFSSTTGVLLYATYFGGTSNDQGMAIAIDNTGAGNPAVYLAGYTTSNTFPGPGPVKAYGGGNDGFLAKFTNAGTLSWWTYFGGTGDDFIYAVTCDLSNNPIIAGQTASAANIASAGAYQTALSGPTDAFVAKFNPTTGAVTWSTYYGGSAQEAAYGVAADPSGNIYITGQTASVVGVATSSAFQTSLDGTNDAFIAEFNLAGARQWGTYFGGPGLDQGNGIAYDAVSGNIAVVGNTTSTSGIASAGGYQTSYGGGTQDAFLAYFTTAGAEKWATYYGGSLADYGQGVCFDPLGDIIIAGGTFSTNGIGSPVGTFAANGFQNAIGGDYDAYVAKINPLGQRMWGSYFGGSLYDFANSVVCSSTWKITLGGFTSSTGLYYAGGIATTGSNQVANGGGVYDGFVTGFAADTLVAIKQPFTDTLVCAGGTLIVSYVNNFAFQAGNVFVVQLSDVTGSFASAVNIGSIVATSVGGSGTVSCVVPSTTAPGYGYRIRIVSSNPMYTSPDDYYNIRVVASIAPSTASATTPSCVGNTITFHDTAAYAISAWSWTGPNSFSSALQNPTLYPATTASAGIYTVTTVHNGCSAVMDTVSVQVNTNIPPMPLDSASSLNCSGTNVYLFSNPDTAATGITFHWSGPGGFTSNLQNPVVYGATTYSNSGTYTIVDSLAGCPSVANTLDIYVQPTSPVSVSIDATPGDTVCAGTMVLFTARPVNGGATPHYQWMSGLYTPIVGAMSNTFASSTLVTGETIFCVVTSDAVCPVPAQATSNVLTMDMIDNPPLVEILASPGNVVTAGSSATLTAVVYNAAAPTYQWTLNGATVGANSSTLTLAHVNANDTIGLTVTSAMNCAVPNYGTATLIVIPSTGVAPVAGMFDDVALFPNPTGGSFTIRGGVQGIGASGISLDVTSTLGQLVYSAPVAIQNNTVDATVQLPANLPDGIYIARLQSGDQSRTLRLTLLH